MDVVGSSRTHEAFPFPYIALLALKRELVFGVICIKHVKVWHLGACRVPPFVSINFILETQGNISIRVPEYFSRGCGTAAQALWHFMRASISWEEGPRIGCDSLNRFHLTGDSIR